jgi:hypothetical protein
MSTAEARGMRSGLCRPYGKVHKTSADFILRCGSALSGELVSRRALSCSDEHFTHALFVQIHTKSAGLSERQPTTSAWLRNIQQGGVSPAARR